MSSRAAALALASLLAFAPRARAAEAPAPPPTDLPAARNGLEIYERFRDGLADPQCTTNPSTRWQAHFAHTPGQLTSVDSDVMPLFGYVVDSVRAAGLPTEFALIPFVESGYKPAARSPLGPAGMWQMIAVTARNHHIAIRPGYDGRLSPVESTRAAVRYLKTLHGMFAGDWRLAVMAYNAGEYRVFNALRRAGQTPAHADPASLPGLSPITHAYVRKLHALSCLLERADDHEEWRQALDRPVPLLRPIGLPAGVNNIESWARHEGLDIVQLRRLNPAFANGVRKVTGSQPLVLLGAPGPGPATAEAIPVAANAIESAGATSAMALAAPNPEIPAAAPSSSGRVHRVGKGDNATRIAQRYGISVAELLERNGLDARSVLRPGQALAIDPEMQLSSPLQRSTAAPP